MENNSNGSKDSSFLESKTIAELYQMAKEREITGYSKMRKKELVLELEKSLGTDKTIPARGVLEVMADGFGFLRPVDYRPSKDDFYVSYSQIRKFDLRTGDRVEGFARKPKDNERYYALLRVEKVNGRNPSESSRRLHFPGLTPIYPNERIALETSPDKISSRIIDMVSPIGKGQRGLIVSPPKAGKTVLLKEVANSIAENNPEISLFVLLIDERPEEVTDIERSVKAEVISSTFDERPRNHIQVAELALERAKRLVEHGADVVILMDSITRLARAYNLEEPPSGRTLSGGVDPNALYGPKKFFGSARNMEEGGSLTIIATALVETGSRMDDVIFEEFKGTGNMELVLDRKLAERRIFPAIDVKRSGTRREELLLPADELKMVWQFRKNFAGTESGELTRMLADALSRVKTNSDLVRVWPELFGKK